MITITATSVSNEAASIEIKLHFKQSLQPPHLSCLGRHGADLLRGTCTSPASLMKPRFKHQGHPWKKTIRSSQFLKFFKKIQSNLLSKTSSNIRFPMQRLFGFRLHWWWYQWSNFSLQWSPFRGCSRRSCQWSHEIPTWGTCWFGQKMAEDPAKVEVRNVSFRFSPHIWHIGFWLHLQRLLSIKLPFTFHFYLFSHFHATIPPNWAACSLKKSKIWITIVSADQFGDPQNFEPVSDGRRLCWWYKIEDKIVGSSLGMVK